MAVTVKVWDARKATPLKPDVLVPAEPSDTL